MPIQDCAICSKLINALQALRAVSFYIGLSPSKKHDFGLYLNAVQAEENQISRLINFHDAYHQGTSPLLNKQKEIKTKKGRQKKK